MILLNHLPCCLLTEREVVTIEEEEVVILYPQCSYFNIVVHTQENDFSLHDFLDKTTNISKFEKVEQSFMMKNIINIYD